MKTIDAKQCTAIALGRLGENDYTVVRFDVSAWLEEVPGAVIGLYNQRPGDNAAYPVAGITIDGGIATWTVTSAELTRTGEGKCELVAIAGEVVAKSAIFNTIVFDALDGSGEAPEPWEEWQQQLIILKNEAEQAADRAEEAVEHYPRIVDGVWEVWDAQTEQWVSTGVQAQGPQGIQGVPGPQGEPGAQGETGPQGEPGADGVTFTPAVSAEGVISWTNDGGKTNPQPVNIKGPQGDKGDTGATGATGPTGQTGPAGAPGVGVPAGGTTGQVLSKASGADYDTEWADPSGGDVTDVQVNGVSVLDAQGVANVPVGTAQSVGVVKPGNGLAASTIDPGKINTVLAYSSNIKAGTSSFMGIGPAYQHESTFYGLAKAAGSDEKNSTLPVGQYTDAAKIAIQKMLGAVGGGDIAYIEPTLNAQRAYEYGDYFVDELGVLSRATDAIAQGGSLVLNTNYEHVSDNGGLTAGMEQEAGLVADVTVGSDIPTGTLSVPLSKPCKRIVVEIKNNNSALPTWSYIRLNYLASGNALYVSTSNTQVKYAYCIIDLVNKIGITLLKNSVDTYDNTCRMTFGTSHHILKNHVIREIGFAYMKGMVEGFNIKVYGR